MQAVEKSQQAVIDCFAEIVECLDGTALFSYMNKYFDSRTKETIKHSSSLSFERNEMIMNHLLKTWRKGETFNDLCKAFLSLKYNNLVRTLETRLRTLETSNEGNLRELKAKEQAELQARQEAESWAQYERAARLRDEEEVRAREERMRIERIKKEAETARLKEEAASKQETMLLKTSYNADLKRRYKNHEEILRNHEYIFHQTINDPLNLARALPNIFTRWELEDVEFAKKKSEQLSKCFGVLIRKLGEHLEVLIKALENTQEINARDFYENALAIYENRSPRSYIAPPRPISSQPVCIMCKDSNKTLLTENQWPKDNMPMCSECANIMKKWSNTFA